MSGTATNRTNISLSTDISAEIIAKTQEQSAVMQLARAINLPGRGLTIPVITSDPTASWVGETESKPVSNPGLNTKIMRGYTLAVIVPFSNQFRRDAQALYTELVNRLPAALGQKFDQTVFGSVEKPGSDFDNFASVTACSMATSVYQGLVDADTAVALAGGINNGYAISPQAKGILLGAVDEQKRPLFINNISEGGVPTILGSKTVVAKGAYVDGSPKTVGFAGDWTKAMYGIVEGVNLTISEDATLDIGGGSTINLFQQNMFAVRAEIEIGFRADTDCFAKLTATSVPSF